MREDVVSGTIDPSIQNKNSNEIRVEDIQTIIDPPEMPEAAENAVTAEFAFDSAILSGKNTGLTFNQFASNVPFLFSSEKLESLISSK